MTGPGRLCRPFQRRIASRVFFCSIHYWTPALRRVRTSCAKSAVRRRRRQQELRILRKNRKRVQETTLTQDSGVVPFHLGFLGTLSWERRRIGRPEAPFEHPERPMSPVAAHTKFSTGLIRIEGPHVQIYEPVFHVRSGVLIHTSFRPSESHYILLKAPRMLSEVWGRWILERPACAL